MVPFQSELTVAGESIPNARAFVRSLNVLLKFSRLYGLEHSRSAGQFDISWNELQEAVRASGDTGLLLGTSGSQLLLDGVPLESTQAERSFAELLNAAGVASICFQPTVQRDEFASLVKVFADAGQKALPLSERLEQVFGKGRAAGIAVNEIRFVAEDAAFSEARMAAQLTAKTLGADAERVQEWFRSPEKMIQLIAAAEGAHGGSGQGGPGVGTGIGSAAGEGAGSAYSGGAGAGFYSGGSGESAGPGASALDIDPSKISAPGATGSPGSGWSAVSQDAGAKDATEPSAITGPTSGGPFAANAPAAGGAKGVAPIGEAEMHSLLRLLAQFGEAANSRDPFALQQSAWQHKLAALPQTAQVTLRQALASVVARTPSAKMDEAALLRLAEDLAIRFALDRFQRGEVRVNAVRQMLEKMGHELETLRKLLKAREDKMASIGMAVESHAEVLDRQFWAAVPESGKRAVLTSPEAWCIPPRNVQQYVEELLGRGESDAAANILLKYAACVRNKDAEARKKAAIGLGQLAELYSRAANQKLQDALVQIGQQLCAEKDPELQTLLSAAFVRLSQEAAQRRYYLAMQQALDSLADLEELRPTWVQSLRPRIGVENRLSDFIEEALAAETMPEGLAGLLVRVPESASEHLAIRLARSGRRSEREKIVSLAKAVGNAGPRHLSELLKSEQPIKAASVVGLLSRLDPLAVENELPQRLRHGGRSFHDTVIRQLAIAGAAERGRLISDLIELIDPLVLPLALDEIGMCGDPQTAPKLLRLAEGEILPEGSDYLRVKAIEALGRMRAPAAAGHLRRFVEARKSFGWAYPDEIRTAAAQALEKLDPDWLRENLPRFGLSVTGLAFAPLDPAPDRDVVRHRRYERIRLPRSVPAVITSQRGKYSSAISVLSLDGGLLSGDIQLAVGTEATLKIPAGLRSINMRAVVRFVRSHQAGFEMVGMGLDDRAKLRRLLVSLGGEVMPVTDAPPKI